MSLAVVSEHDDERDVIERLRGAREKINSELSKVIIGQQAVIEELLIALFSGGHCLITGAPGLAKTLLVQSVSDLFHLKFSRIQSLSTHATSQSTSLSVSTQPFFLNMS